MLKFSRKLMLLALLSALAATTTGSAVAANGSAKLTVKTGVITVTNRGYGPLTITADPAVTRISGTGSFAIVTPATGTPCAKTLVVAGKGGACTIGVKYTPLDTEISTARVTLADTGGKTATQETIISVR